MQKWFLKGLNPLVILWILLSLLLLFCTAKFRLNDYIYAPQHGQFDNFELIKQHNDTIRWVLRDYENYKLRQWGVVEPPLARVLSEPAVRYQEAMVYYHPEVQRAFARIDAYLNTPEIIDNSFKQRIQRTIKADTLINPYQKFNKQ